MRGHLTKKKKPNSDEYYRNWYVVVDMVDEFGRRKRKWIATKTDKKKEAEKALAKIVNEANEGKLVIEKEITFGELIERFMKRHVKKTLSLNTQKQYEWAFKKVPDNFKKTPLSKIIPSMVIHVLDNEEKKNPNTRSLRHLFFAIRTCLNKAVRRGLIFNNPTNQMDPPKQESSSKKILTPDQLNELLQIVKGTRYYTPLLLAISCGVRRGEICGLQWQDVDFENNILRIQRSLDVIDGQVIIKSPKTSSGTRSIKMPTIPCQMN